MKAKSEILLFSATVFLLNCFLFGFAAFVIAKVDGLSSFVYLILATLFLFSTAASIYTAYQTIALSLRPMENFKILIENTIHELNTPIATIKTNTAMLKKNADEAKLKKIERIELSCDKLLDLYDNLEYFAKKEARLEQKAEIDIKTVLEKELELYADSFAKKTVSLSSSISPLMCAVNKKGLSIAISNLLSNALKYTDSGGTVNVELNAAVLSVKDTGCGIGEDELIKIFDRYYQEDAAKEGRGIGLFLVKEFCDDNGISLFIRSEVGVGSEFTLDFDKIRKKN